MYNDQWALPRIRAPQAWGYFSNASPVLHCIVDTGVKWDHPDLAANLVAMSPDFKAANYDDNGHGSHVAGIMGAVANNGRGISGAAWRSKILACKALDAGGWGLISKVVECIEFCRSKGARVINTSFVLTEANAALRDAIRNGTASGVFFAGAAGNTGSDNDQTNFYPGGFAFPGNVAVANIDQSSSLHSSSNFGAKTVQLAAPGAQILSTWIYRDVANQYYTYATGTSMAAPYVSAAAGLAIAASGGRVTNAEVADALIATSTGAPQLKGKVVANGFINLEKLVLWAVERGKQLAAAAAAGR